MRIIFSPRQVIGQADRMLYGHFLEHFHRQVYGGVYDPSSPFADEDGFRSDVIEALKAIRTPIIRWPGGCYVSAYDWKCGVGSPRVPTFDKAWRVEESNAFGTDEFVRLCRKIGCEPYICTNAGTGTAEEMSDWLEYCNLKCEGEFARMRIAHGYPLPHRVKYWSIGNENYGWWEIGAKSPEEWGRLVLESAKMMKHVDPTAQLSAAALADIDWNVKLLKHCGQYLDWISIHRYWNLMPNKNDFANYEQTMAYTADLDSDIRKVRGLLMAFGLEKQIRIAFDEWNLRGWHHPGVHTIRQAVAKEDYLHPRDLNDRNQDYTMADAVFTACFLNTLNRNCDIVGMANFAPIVNTRGCIFTHREGLVLRGTYHVFDLYVNYLGEEVLDAKAQDAETISVVGKDGAAVEVPVLDVLCTRRRQDDLLAIAAVNKHPCEARRLEITPTGTSMECRVISVNGEDVDAFNDINQTGISLVEGNWISCDAPLSVSLAPHSINVIQIRAHS